MNNSADARKFADGEDHIGGHFEVLSDAQGQVEAGAVLSSLQISNRVLALPRPGRTHAGPFERALSAQDETDCGP